MTENTGNPVFTDCGKEFVADLNRCTMRIREYEAGQWLLEVSSEAVRYIGMENTGEAATAKACMIAESGPDGLKAFVIADLEEKIRTSDAYTAHLLGQLAKFDPDRAVAMSSSYEAGRVKGRSDLLREIRDHIDRFD